MSTLNTLNKEVYDRQQLKRVENRTHRDDSRLIMKSQLIAIVAAVLVVGCGPSEADKALIYAAGDGRIEEIKLHLAVGADVYTEDEFGQTPLGYAVGGGHKEIIELLIAEGADVNAESKLGTPLQYLTSKEVTKEFSEGHKELAALCAYPLF